MNQSQSGFCPELDRLLREGRTTGRSGKRFEDLGAISTHNNLQTLRAVLSAVRPARTLEVGLAFGGSAAVFAAHHRDRGLSPDRQHTAIDPFQTTVWDGCGEALLERAGLSGYVAVAAEPSHAALPRLLATRERVDVAYIDGSHLFEDVFIDLFYTARLLTVGGVLLFDDSQDPHVRKVLRFVRRNLAAFAPLPLSELGYAPPTGQWRKRLTNLLGRQQMTAFRKTAETGGSFRAWNSPLVAF